MNNKINITDYIQNLETGSIERLLNYYEKDGKLICNFNNQIIIDVDENLLETFHLTTDMFWPQISYLIYETTSLYWVLYQLNTDLVKNCFQKVEAPNHIKYIPNILRAIDSIAD